MIRQKVWNIMVIHMILIQSCEYHHETDPVSCNADQKQISFSKDIKPLLANKCLACHASVRNSAAGIIFETYDQIKYWAQSGDLVTSVSSINGNVPRMPAGGAAPLTECEVTFLQNWLQQGLLNN